MKKSEEKQYIQNRAHWCWATACKIVVERYKRNHKEYTFNIVSDTPQYYGQVTALEYEKGVLTDNLDGINWKLQQTNEVRIDAWQRAIVMNANTIKYTGYEGNVDGDDEAKETLINELVNAPNYPVGHFL